MAIYVKQGAALIEMTEQRYDAESVLQQLLTDHPNLLVGDQDGDRRKRWLLVKAEMGVADDPEAASRWSLDHLFLDEEGVPTLVEVKRSTDTRIRREGRRADARLRSERFLLLGHRPDLGGFRRAPPGAGW